MHLKYVVEVEKTRSINRAAENLFMGQPNLSRAIKELEDSLGITIFNRTTKGITTTPQGKEFLMYAKKILSQVDAVENMYKHGESNKQVFSASVPHASYISLAFSEFVKKVPRTEPIEFFYKESTSKNTLSSLIKDEYKIGVLRYRSDYDAYFKSMLSEKDIHSEFIAEFRYVLLFSKYHPLVDNETIQSKDLEAYIEIAHADPYIPSLPMIDAQKENLSEGIDKRIFLFERASQFDLLSNDPTTFMWVSPIPQNILDKYGLVQKNCNTDNDNRYTDVIIYKNEYKLSSLDVMFKEELLKAKSTLSENRRIL